MPFMIVWPDSGSVLMPSEASWAASLTSAASSFSRSVFEFGSIAISTSQGCLWMCTAISLSVKERKGRYPSRPSSRTRLRLLDFQRREFAGDDEVVVVERQRARDAVFVKLEADGVDRCLLAVL